MRHVANNGEQLHNETPLDCLAFTSFRSTSPFLGLSFHSLLSLSSVSTSGEIVRRNSRCTCVSPSSPTVFCVSLHPRPTLSHPFLLANSIKKYLKYPEYTSAKTPFVETVEKQDRLYPIVRAFGERFSGGSSL